MIRVHTLGVRVGGGLREQIHALEEAGIDGVFVTDHLFVSHGEPRREARGSGDPFVTLAAAAMASDRLMLGTSVVNTAFAHPALAIRSFCGLAELVGGERVLAGIGAGWNREEFDALGMSFPPFAQRMDRLEEAAALARAAFDHGFVDHAGAHVTTRELPLSAPSPPPRLLLGGGSDRLLEIAGRHADIVDLNGSSRRLKLGGAQPVRDDPVRRFTTTTADLVDSVRRVRSSASAVGRDADRIEFSILVSAVRFCPQAEVDGAEAELCRQVGMDPQSLGDCPYVFVGPPERMADLLAERAERLGLRHLILTPLDHDVLVRFRSEVVAAG